jgi:hypothetical protein
MLRIPHCLDNRLIDCGKVSHNLRKRKLGSWVRIPLRHVCVCSVCVLYRIWVESTYKKKLNINSLNWQNGLSSPTPNYIWIIKKNANIWENCHTIDWRNIRFCTCLKWAEFPESRHKVSHPTLSPLAFHFKASRTATNGNLKPTPDRLHSPPSAATLVTMSRFCPRYV